MREKPYSVYTLQLQRQSQCFRPVFRFLPVLAYGLRTTNSDTITCQFVSKRLETLLAPPSNGFRGEVAVFEPHGHFDHTAEWHVVDITDPARKVIHGKVAYAELEQLQPWEVTLAHLERWSVLKED